MTAPVATKLDGYSSNSDTSTPQNPNNVSPSNGSYVIAALAFTNGLSSLATVNSVAGLSATWTKILEAAYPGANYAWSIWISNAISGSPTGKVTWTLSASQTAFCGFIIQVTNLNSVFRWLNATSGNGTTSPTLITLPAFYHSDNGVIAFWLANTNTATFWSPEAGWTELDEKNIGEFFADMTAECEYKASNDTSATVTENSNTPWLGIAFELNTQTITESETIASSLKKVTAALNAQLSSAQIVASLKHLTASLNVSHRQQEHITSALTKLTASINLSQRQEEHIASTIAKLTSNLNVTYHYEFHIVPQIAKVSASLGAVQRQELSINSTIAKLMSDVELNAVANDTLMTIQFNLAKIAASLNIEHRQEFSIASTLVKAQALLNVAQIYQASVNSSLAKTTAIVNVAQSQLLYVLSTLAKMSDSLNLQQEDRLTISTQLARLTALINLQANYQLNITTVIEALESQFLIALPIVYHFLATIFGINSQEFIAAMDGLSGITGSDASLLVIGND